MIEYQNILVVADPTREEQPALARAVHLARRYNAKLSLFSSIYDLSYEMTSMLSKDERNAMRQGVVEQQREWLQEVVSSYSDVTIECEVIWHNRPFEAIIQKVLSGDYDLLIKGTHQHDKLKSVIFTPTDWHLLRKAPCNVLMVKEHDWPEQGNIITAVNAVSEDQAHQDLNHQLIKHSRELAQHISANVLLVNGYPGTPVNIAIEIPDFDPTVYNESVKQHHLQKLHELALSQGIDKANCLVEEGLPEDVIPRLAREKDAELVVLGTIGRTGLSAAFIGNTAEHVIDKLNCDLLAIKPADFVSPVSLDE